MPSLEDIPIELLNEIFSHCGCIELARLSLVSKYFSQIIKKPTPKMRLNLFQRVEAAAAGTGSE